MDRTLSQNKDLLFELTKTSFKLRYNGSVLGMIWVLLKPLLIFTIQYIVFSTFFKNQSISNYPIYLLLGILLYNYFNEAVIFGMNSLLDKAHIILKVNFAKNVAVMSAIFMALVNLLINLIVLLIFIFFNEVNANLESVLYSGFILLTLTLALYAVALFSSVIAVKIRDLKNIFEIFIQLGYYLVPIFYPITIIPESYRPIIELNPLTIIIQSIRSAIIDGQIINLKSNIIIGLATLVLLALGTVFFNKNIKRIAEYY